MKKIILILPILFLLSSCEKAFMEPNPATDNLAIYDEYWKLVSEKFAMFDDPGKAIDKEKLHSTTRAMVSDHISSSELFDVLGIIAVTLKDAHSFIENDLDYKTYNNEEGIPLNLDQSVIDMVYLTGQVQTQGDGLRYTLLKNNTIGYIQYRDFDNEVTDAMMNTILDYFKGTKGIILDVRGNGGGDPFVAALMASHFTNKKVYIGYETFKTGPNPTDFHKSLITIKPAGGKKYLKPLMVLTNIQCFSATTTLISYLNPLDNVTFIGAKTGGGSGSTSDGFLANGWHWQLSTSEFIDWEGRRLDNGFEPDISVSLDLNNGTEDEIIERAILELQ